MDGLVELPADPARRGRVLGGAWREALRSRIEESKQRLRLYCDPSLDVVSLIDRFASLLGRLAGAWLAEVTAMAEAADVGVEDVLLLNAVPIPDPKAIHDGRSAENNCSSFVWVDDGRVVLFKIRDERPYPQVVYSYPNPDGRIITVGKDIGNIGIAHGVSARGIAGANNTGSFVGRLAAEGRFTDCHLLRYIVEHANGVDDVDPILDHLLCVNAVGGASTDRGSILLAADQVRAVAAEVVSDKKALRRVDSGFVPYSNHFQIPEAQSWQVRSPDRNSLARLARLTELGSRIDRENIPASMFAMARDRANPADALCNDDSAHPWMTVSAHLHLLGDSQPTYACCGNPRNSVFLPIPIDVARSPGVLLSGTLFQMSHRLYRAYGSGDHLVALQDRVEASFSAPSESDLLPLVDDVMGSSEFRLTGSLT
jgi:hypothetical protein